MGRQTSCISMSLLSCLLGTAAPAANVTPTSDAVGDACAALGPPATPVMVSIPSGSYKPFFKTPITDKTGWAPTATVAVSAFRMDATAVTRGEYLRFLCSNPDWRKSNVKALFAEPRYLADWAGDLDPGSQPLEQPVTNVSWFAARAYCASRNARLPTVMEWERAAGSGITETLAKQRGNNAFQFAMGQAAPDLQAAGLRFGKVWEWNADFNSVAGSSTSSGAGTRSSLFCGDGFRSTDASDYAAFLRYSFRNSLRANYTLKNLGFRCVTEAH